MSVHFGHHKVSRHDSSTSDAWSRYTCGHCGATVSGAVVASASDVNTGVTQAKWLQCPICFKPSAQWNENIYPGTPQGPNLEGLPESVEAAYNEARDCFSINAFTAVELLCRKILMYVACDKGASEGNAFASYLDYLEAKGYVTPAMLDWVKKIKDHGNDATHRLEKPDKQRADNTFMFTIQLLRIVYEMSHIASKYTKPATP